MDFIEEVKFWVSKAKAADPELKVFGASSHKYEFDPPADISEVRAFEQKHGIKLPENYVRVLTELGNGGAGPDYGLYPVEKLGNGCTDQIVTNTTFLDASLTPEIWKQVMQGMNKVESDAEAYDKILEQVVANAVVIGTQGCTYDTILMCGGSENGKIVYIDWNMEEDYPPHFTHMTFEEWYLGFFKEVAAGNNLRGYGYTRLGTEKELIADYEKAVTLEKEARINERKEIIRSLNRFRQLSSDTIRELRAEPDEELIPSIISLILQSDQKIGLEMFNGRFFSDHPEQVILMCRSIPDEIKGLYYKRALEILYDNELSARRIPAIVGNDEVPCVRNLLYFLGECSCRSAKDIIPYAESGNNPDECRGTATYEICNCPDVSQYQEAVARLMHSSVYNVAFNAMQGALRANLKDPVIINAYRWMKEYYKDDKTIQSNLERVDGLRY
ncbi:MAG: SMI1/KNR4 family protein [Ruminococcus sp.]|nr:SMI1/KNR4 family protein [Ruminococcus sp.]